jgi:hypothetical protein
MAMPIRKVSQWNAMMRREAPVQLRHSFEVAEDRNKGLQSGSPKAYKSYGRSVC